MKRIAIVSLLGAASLFGLAGCEQGGSDKLIGGGTTWDPNFEAAGEENTFDHNKEMGSDPSNPVEPGELQLQETQVGSAEVVARLHSLNKMPYDSLGRILSGIGVNTANQTANSAGALYRGGGSAMGVAVYTGRVPEALIPSTAALNKQFDIFMAAAPEIITNIGTSRRCPQVVLVQNNQFTEDGISCLMGKPAKQEHVILANQLVNQASTPQLGTQIAVATLLAASHTGE